MFKKKKNINNIYLLILKFYNKKKNTKCLFSFLLYYHY